MEEEPPGSPAAAQGTIEYGMSCELPCPAAYRKAPADLQAYALQLREPDRTLTEWVQRNQQRQADAASPRAVDRAVDPPCSCPAPNACRVIIITGKQLGARLHRMSLNSGPLPMQRMAALVRSDPAATNPKWPKPWAEGEQPPEPVLKALLEQQRADLSRAAKAALDWWLLVEGLKITFESPYLKSAECMYGSAPRYQAGTR